MFPLKIFRSLIRDVVAAHMDDDVLSTGVFPQEAGDFVQDVSHLSARETLCFCRSSPDVPHY